MSATDATKTDVTAADITAADVIDIVLNGAPRQVPPGHTLEQLVAALALSGQALALAVNRSVVPRQQWPVRALRAHDQVDIVRAIGGG